jgi:hypothetical protein
MFQRLSNSWELVKESARVLQADKELILFPLFSGVALIIVTASFLIPLALVGIVKEAGGALSLGAYVVIFLFYFVQYFVIIFFNSGLVGAALIRLEGGDPTFGDGIRIAMNNLGSIVGYAAIAATVGMILRMVKEKAGWVGKLLAVLGGVAWSLATYLVVPVLVAKGLGPIDAIQESTSILRRTWGEQIAGSLGIGFFFGMATVVYSLVMIPLVALVAIAGGPLFLVIFLAVLTLIGYLLLALVSSALKGVYSAALYRFATTGEAGMFDRQLLSGAFRAKV